MKQQFTEDANRASQRSENIRTSDNTGLSCCMWISTEVDTSVPFTQFNPSLPAPDRRYFSISPRGQKSFPVCPSHRYCASLFYTDEYDDQPKRVDDSEWTFGRYESPESNVILPSNEHICLCDATQSFVKGRLYHIVYPTAVARHTGASLLAVRMVGLFLKNGEWHRLWPRLAQQALEGCNKEKVHTETRNREEQESASENGAVAEESEKENGTTSATTSESNTGRFRAVCAMGASQCGRFLRSFIYDDFNEMSQAECMGQRDREVFDGFVVLVAGASRGQFRHYGGQNGTTLPHLAWDRLPFLAYTTTEQEEKMIRECYQSLISTGTVSKNCDDTNLYGISIQRALIQHRSCAKIIYVNTSIEYHRGDASLLHTSPDGQNDLCRSSPNTRIFAVAGMPHNPIASWPPSCADGLPSSANPIQQTLTIAHSATGVSEKVFLYLIMS